MSDSVDVPAHVPPSLVRDIDPYAMEGGDTDPYAAWAKVQKENPELIFMPRYGGYWVVTRKRLLDQILLAPDDFSSFRAGVFPELPDNVPPMAPLQVDPPDHRYFRQPFNIALSPKRIAALRERAREIVIGCLDSFYQQGHCEFMRDVAAHVPITIVMQIFDLPYEDRDRLMPLVDTILRTTDQQERLQSTGAIFAYCDEYVTKREEQPGDDLISTLLKIKVGDRPVQHHEIVSTVTLLLLGGLDSISHSIGFMMLHLAKHPEHQQKLAEDLESIPDALDELLRRFAISIPTRKATRDMELEGVTIKKGDKFLMVLPASGIDERSWPDAGHVDFARKPKDYLNFGSGLHVCVGKNLARAELIVILEEWFKRIPSFGIKPGDKAQTSAGNVLGVVRLPLSWNVA